MSTTINNYGTFVCGNVIIDSVVGNTVINNNIVQKAVIEDSQLIRELRAAAARIEPEGIAAQKKVLELQEELATEKPRTGKIQAIYDWLRRNCKAETVLATTKVFGELLIKAMG